MCRKTHSRYHLSLGLREINVYWLLQIVDTPCTAAEKQIYVTRSETERARRKKEPNTQRDGTIRSHVLSDILATSRR